MIEVIQVCHKLTPQNRDREERGIIAAIKAFDLKNGTIITNSDEEEIKEGSYRISVVPYWKWMLSLFSPID